jgi:hypothetical protein
LIRLDKTPGNYSITVANSGFNQKIAGFASLSYSNGDPSVTSAPSINYGGISTSTDIILFDETRIEMLNPSQSKGSPDQTFILTAGRIRKAWEWSLNGNHSYGLALEAMKPFLWNPQSAANSSLVIATKNNTWVDIIFSMSGNMSVLQPSHPLHKHSNRVYVLVSLISVITTGRRAHTILGHLLTPSFRVLELEPSSGLRWQRLRRIFQKTST